jgi:hypothetical protein
MESSENLNAVRPHNIEVDNDATHDSTVDTDGKNREATRLASGGTISPDEITTSNASLVNAMPEAGDGFAGFDSRPGGNHLALALRDGYMVVEMGFDAPLPIDPDALGLVHRKHGREHWPGHMRRPERVIELKPTPR